MLRSMYGFLSLALLLKKPYLWNGRALIGNPESLLIKKQSADQKHTFDLYVSKKLDFYWLKSEITELMSYCSDVTLN